MMATLFHGVAVRDVHVDLFCSDDMTLRRIIEDAEAHAPSWRSILVRWAPDGKHRDIDSHQSVTISRISGSCCSGPGRPCGSALKATET
jgi:hypothetical protein